MAIDRNDPEVKALLEEAVKDATEALSDNNRKLQKELQNARARAKGADIDPEEYAKLQTEVEELRTSLTKTESHSKKEMEKLSKALQTKDAALSQHLIDAGLTDALVKAGVAVPFLPAVKAMFKNQAALKAKGDTYSALIGDKSISEAITAWAGSDEGKHFVSAPANGGGGATGGNAGGSNVPKSLTDAKTKDEQLAVIRGRLEKANKLAA